MFTDTWKAATAVAVIAAVAAAQFHGPEYAGGRSVSVSQFFASLVCAASDLSTWDTS